MHLHQRFLPPAFSDFKIEQGGVGAGTLTFAPPAVERLYNEALGRLNAYATGHRTA